MATFIFFPQPVRGLPGRCEEISCQTTPSRPFPYIRGASVVPVMEALRGRFHIPALPEIFGD